MAEFTISSIIRETVWQPPESLADEAFMEEWSRKKFGVGFTEDLRAKFKRAQYVAEHLMQMIPDEVWSNHGGGTFEGHDEGLYQRDRLADEIESWLS